MAKAALKLQPIDMQPGCVVDLPLDLIDFDPEQPRKDIDLQYIEELAADIKTNGVLQPITVRPNPDAPGRYFVVYGECRTRGSRIAKKQTVPALLDADRDNLSRLINQVKENHIRRNLNPIEMAQVLRRLRDEHKLKSNSKIEETLKAHGITNMSGSYISNIIRLVDLPDWAQQAIRSGRLTGAHGKYLLQAAASEPVMEYLRADLGGCADMSVRDLQQEIADAFDENHPNLNASWKTPFDYVTECKGCQKMRKISGNENYEGSTYCLDSDCHEEKRKAAQEARSKAATQASANENDDGQYQEGVPPTVSEDGSVDVDLEANENTEWLYLNNPGFDTAACAACEHHHMARAGDQELGYACFQQGLQCHTNKRKAAQEARRAAEEREEKILDWLGSAIAERCAEDQTAQLAILSYTALVAGGSAYSARQAARERTGLCTMRQLLATDISEVAHGTFPELISALDDGAQMQLAAHLGISISDYSEDEADREIWNSLIEDAAEPEEDGEAHEAA